MQRPVCTRALGLTAALGLGVAASNPAAETLDFTAGTRNLSPVAALFALEPPVPRERDGITMSLSTASHAIGEAEGNNAVLFDGETNVLELTATRGFGDDWRVAMTLPYVWHDSGSLDPLIDGWHEFFGLPDGIRDEVARDDLRFEYLRDGVRAIDLTRNTRGPGDMRVAASWSPQALSRRGLSVAVGAKLPTGDADKLTGSGSADFSAALHWRRRAPDTRWLFEGAAGVALLGDADLPLGDQRDTAWLGHVAIGYRATPILTLGARLQMHAGPVRDGPDPLSDASVLATFGGAWQVAPKWRVDFTFDEDLNVETAPDIVFRVALTRGFE